MQSYGEQVALLDRELAELRLRLPKVHDDRIGVVEDEIEALQHALQDLELPAPAGAAERELQARDQTRAWLRQEKLRLGQREDRIRQEKANLLQLQLHLFEAKLQVRSRAGVPCDVESGELDTRLEEELVDYAEYYGAVRLIPPCLILLVLSALAAWFGSDLLHNQPGLTTTQKVASIGSATFTVITVVALLVRAAMCTAEWQWTLHTSYCVTGWYWLKPMPQHSRHLQQQQQLSQQLRPELNDAAPFVLDKVPSIPQPPTSDLASDDIYRMEDDSSSQNSLDGSDLEDVKKQS